MLVSAVQQRESAISIRMSPPSLTSFPLSAFNPSRLSQSTRLSSLLHSNFLLAIFLIFFNLFTRSSVYVPVPPSRLVPPSLSPAISTSLFSMRASLFLHYKWVPQYHLSRVNIYSLICNIYFSLSDLTSLCITGSRFLLTTDSNSLLFMAK